MDLSPAIGWNPPERWERITVIDSHTGGEPFRVVVGGLPDIPGESVLSRRRHARAEMDHLRKALMWEPRGHADMYGGWVGPPIRPDSDLSVLFLHNEGFSTMCGHGIIALVKVVLDTGIVPLAEGPTTTLRIDTPAGQVTATATVENGFVDGVSFVNVPSFVAELDARVDLPDLGTVVYDLAFGGAFYAYVDQPELGIDVSDLPLMISTARAIKRAILETRPIVHPLEPDLGFLYGVIFTGPPADPANSSRHVCVFAEGEVDRSPTGTGVSGRLAILHARGEVEPGDEIRVESVVGSVFRGRIVDIGAVGDIPAVVPEVSGKAHITGRAEMWVDPDDHLGQGFLLR